MCTAFDIDVDYSINQYYVLLFIASNASEQPICLSNWRRPVQLETSLPRSIVSAFHHRNCWQVKSG
jgi:hypothetical protein